MAFLLFSYLDFPVSFLPLVLAGMFGAVYALAALLILGTVWWFFLGWLMEWIVSLYRTR